MVGARRLAGPRLPDPKSGGSAIPREPRAEKMASPTGFAPVISCMRGRHVDWTTPQGQKMVRAKGFCTFGLMHVTRPLWLAELCPHKMVGTKSAALFASRMSNERSADELRPQNKAGERSRTVVSALGRPHSAVEPHPLEMVSPAGISPATWSLGRSCSVF